MERREKYNNGLISGLALAGGEPLKRSDTSLAIACAMPMFAVTAVSLALVFPFAAIADQTAVQAGKGPQPPAHVRFNTAFIQGSDQPPDLKAFLDGASVVPGTYRVDVFINRALSGRRDITFMPNPATGAIEPCLTLDMLMQLGLDPQRLEGANAAQPPDACFDLPARIEFAHIDYQPNNLRLNISVPQAAMSRSAKGYVPPELWDEGQTAGFLNYSFSGSRRSQRGQSADQYYLGLRNGLNLGAWRLRNESSLVYGDAQPYRFRSNRTFVQRDVTAFNSQLTLGEIFTDSQVFDSVRFLGASLASDDGMLPDSLRTYAPIIRGIAETNAIVEVRQNGFMLYSGNVSPGPFEISDIYPSGSNGDLEVTVIEADGRRRVFIQAYASLPIMVPEGAFRYSLAAGEYDSNQVNGVAPHFASGTLIYGLSDRVTGFGGMQMAEAYQAGNLGTGINTGFGAVSADVTHSISQQREQTLSGQSVRLRYANTLQMTHTTLAVAGYRYSTDQYRTFDEHVDELSARGGRYGSGRAKDRLELNVTQALPDVSGSLTLTGSEQRYWDRTGKTRQLYLSYNASWHSLSYNLSVERNQTFDRSGQSETDHRIALTLSFPLGSNPGASRVAFNAVRDSAGDYNAQAGLNGQFFEDRDTFYSVQAGHDNRSGSSGFGKLNTTTPYGRFDVGYGQGSQYRTVSVGAAGSVVAHAGGVNLGQTLGETFALIQVKDVGGARLANYSNVQTAGNGFAVLPYAQPYRTNWISLDTRQLGADVELENAVTQIVPRRGAMPLVAFKAAVGRRVQFELRRADGNKLPLGAVVEDERGKVLAAVDPTSRALVLSDEDHGVIKVSWSDQQCSAAFSLPPRDPARTYERLKVVCQ
jgi:outer membrane usher protein